MSRKVICGFLTDFFATVFATLCRENLPMVGRVTGPCPKAKSQRLVYLFPHSADVRWKRDDGRGMDQVVRQAHHEMVRQAHHKYV